MIERRLNKDLANKQDTLDTTAADVFEYDIYDPQCRYLVPASVYNPKNHYHWMPRQVRGMDNPALTEYINTRGYKPVLRNAAVERSEVLKDDVACNYVTRGADILLCRPMEYYIKENQMQEQRNAAVREGVFGYIDPGSVAANMRNNIMI